MIRFIRDTTKFESPSVIGSSTPAKPAPSASPKQPPPSKQPPSRPPPPPSSPPKPTGDRRGSGDVDEKDWDKGSRGGSRDNDGQRKVSHLSVSTKGDDVPCRSYADTVRKPSLLIVIECNRTFHPISNLQSKSKGGKTRRKTQNSL